MATTPKDTSLSSAFRYAIDQPLENMATTFQALGMEGWEKFMRDLVEEPENYEAAAGEFINAQGEGFNWEYFPRAVFEQAGQIAGSLATRAGGAAIGATAGPGGAVAGALLGPALFEAVQIAGPVALERARNEGREEPNWEDWTGALGTAAASGALNAVGIKNVGVLNSTIKQVGKATAAEGLTEGVQGSLEQIGGTALTEAGLQFDTKAAVGEALLGAGAGGGTQVGAQTIGQIAPPVLDGTLGANRFLDIKNLFGKKKDTKETPTEQPVPLTELSIEERIAQTRVESDQKIRRAFPELSAAFENPQDLAFVDNQIIQSNSYIGDNSDLSAFDLQALLPQIDDALANQAEFNDFDLTPEIRNEIIKQLANDVATHAETYAREDMDQFSDTGSVVSFDADKITDAANDLLFDYFGGAVKASNALPSGQFEIDEPRPLFNKLPGVVAGHDSQLANDEFDVVPPLGAVIPEFDPKTVELLQNSPKGPIDPVFMSHSPVWAHLQNITKKPIAAEEMMKNLYFEIRPAQEAPGAREHGTFKPITTEAKKNEIATQAIEARIGEFLLDRAKKGKSVTRDDVLKVLQDHRGRFTTTLLSEDGMFIDGSEYKTSATPALEAWTEGKLAELMEQEIKKSDILPEGYDMGAANRPTRPLPNGEDAFVNEMEDVVRPKVKEKLEKALKSEGLAALLPFMPKKATSALEPYKPKYPHYYMFDFFNRGEGNEDFKLVGPAIEIGLKYDPRTAPIVEQAVQAELTESINDPEEKISVAKALQKANLQKTGDPAFIKQTDSSHYWMGPGMLGWIRGGLYSHEDGAIGLLLHEIQSKYHAVAQDPDDSQMYRSHVRDASDMTKEQKKLLLEGKKLLKAYEGIKDEANVDRARLVLKALGATKDYTDEDMPGDSWALIDSESVHQPMPGLANRLFTFSLPPITKGNLENSMKNLYETEYRPKLEKRLKEEILSEQPLQGIAGYTFEDNSTLDAFVDDVVEGKVGSLRPLPSAQMFIQQPLVELGILDDAATKDELGEAAYKVDQLFTKFVLPDVARENENKLYKAIEPVAVDVVTNDVNIGQVYTMLTAPKKGKAANNFPSSREYKALRTLARTENVEERNVIADAPLKKGFPQAMVQASISKILMTDPDVNHLYIPQYGHGGAPQSVYKNAIKEAKRISKQFEPNLEFKEVASFPVEIKDPVTKQGVTVNNKVYALEIGALREKVILEGGFPGKMTGGLVKKAVNQTFNLGDYGQKFI